MGATLLLSGDTLLVFSAPTFDDLREDLMPLLGGSGEVTVVQQVDVSDPSDPELTGTLEIDAHMLDARQSGDRISLVTVSRPSLQSPIEPDVYYSQKGPNPADEREQENRNRQAIEDSTAEDWLPGYRLDAGGEETSGVLVDCD